MNNLSCFHLFEISYRNALCIAFIAEDNSKGIACYHGEDLLCIFPLINLLSSPSQSVKASASHLLSRASRQVLELSDDPRKVQIPMSGTSTLRLGFILLRLLHHLWFQVI